MVVLEEISLPIFFPAFVTFNHFGGGISNICSLNTLGELEFYLKWDSREFTG